MATNIKRHSRSMIFCLPRERSYATRGELGSCVTSLRRRSLWHRRIKILSKLLFDIQISNAILDSVTQHYKIITPSRCYRVIVQSKLQKNIVETDVTVQTISLDTKYTISLFCYFAMVLFITSVIPDLLPASTAATSTAAARKATTTKAA